MGDDAIEIWEENETTMQLFARMGTQWHHAPNGRPTGLRYEALPAVARRCHIGAAERDAVFDGLQVMEAAALEVFRGR
jgi:hypothetical protein